MEDITWTAPEFEHHEKEVLWSWASIIIAIILLTTAILSQNFLFGIFIVIAEVLVLVWGNRPPREILFELNDKSLIIEKRENHPLKELDHFGFIDLGEEEKYMEIGLAFKKIRPMMRILMPKELQKPIEQRLKLHGRKKEMEPTLSDVIERLVRF